MSRHRSDRILSLMGITRWERRADLGARPPEEAASVWGELRQSVSQCTRCRLHEGRCDTVFGAGSPGAAWCFVGGAPGTEEDRQGQPFVGRAGTLLDAMLRALALTREEVFITNILKCRSPANRDPEPLEVESCLPFLTQQLAHVVPKIIVALGELAAHGLLATRAPLSELRGRVHDYGGTPLVVTYEPDYLLQHPADKGAAWADLKRARETFLR